MEKSGAWWVDQGFMHRWVADERRKGWSELGLRCLMVKWTHYPSPKLKIVPRPNPPIPWKFPFLVG
jgi:hypothetical protein